MLDQLIHVLRLRQGELALSLAQGSAATWDMYCRMVGEYQGITRALQEIDNLLSDDEEDNP